jgi:peptidoglycan/LPS O-acetylase OafA/YrhL
MNRIKSLDGMRAIAILLVLFAHSLPTMPQHLSKNKYNLLVTNGDLGVTIFFVISGYLITKLLVFEREKTGKISLKDFYLRRIFRIFPVFYLYIIVIVLLKCFFIPTLFENYSTIGIAALYLWNYIHVFNVHISASDHGPAIFSHFWSLAVEEQFYLLWPIMLIKLNTETLKKVAIGIILITPFIRVATYFLVPETRGKADMMVLEAGGNSILIGCLGALIENTNFFKEKILRIISNNGLICFFAIFLFIISPFLWLYLKGPYNVPIGNGINSICIILLLFWCVNIPSKVSGFLNSKVLIQIGLLSYSIYVWQQLFMNAETHCWFNKFPLNIFLALIVAVISYYLVEKPILRLKKRFTRI